MYILQFVLLKKFPSELFFKENWVSDKTPFFIKIMFHVKLSSVKETKQKKVHKCLMMVSPEISNQLAVGVLFWCIPGGALPETKTIMKYTSGIFEWHIFGW